MKLAILGTGMIVNDMLRMINKLQLEKIYLLATERSKEKAENLSREYKLSGIYYDYDELLASDADTVYVALPNNLHFDFAYRALSAGKHVILEKPGTANLRELIRLKELAEAKGLIVLEAVSTHFLPAFKAIKSLLPKAGEIKLASFNYSQYSSRYDAFKQGTILPAFDPAKAGGALMDINLYNINAIVGLFGKPKSYKYYPNIECNIDTSGTMVMEYGGFVATATGAKDCKAPTVSIIQGTNGYFRLCTPLNSLNGFEFAANNGQPVDFTFGDEHRLYHEFAVFKTIIEELDHDRAKELMERSLIVAEIIENARLQEGIRFANDDN